MSALCFKYTQPEEQAAWRILNASEYALEHTLRTSADPSARIGGLAYFLNENGQLLSAPVKPDGGPDKALAKHRLEYAGLSAAELNRKAELVKNWLADRCPYLAELLRKDTPQAGTVQERQKAAAETAFASYNFGERVSVELVRPWSVNDSDDTDDWVREIRINPDTLDTLPATVLASFHVKFARGTTLLEDTYALLMSTGAEIGEAVAFSAPVAEVQARRPKM